MESMQAPCLATTARFRQIDQHVRVLIADDQPRARKALKALIATIGLDGRREDHQPEIEVVGEAGDGSEALRLVKEYQPDIVLMDIRMPGMNGLEATRLIKQNFRTVQVVVLTMYSSDRTDALAAGADAFLIKGCPSEELEHAILGSSTIVSHAN
jgi:DNA-binding NarL/FixJ family response regulator